MAIRKIFTKPMLMVFALLILFAGMEGKLQANQDEIEFEHLSIEDGLSQSSVFCILQDNQGFMWFGTQNGLNRYDGYNFKYYLNTPEEGSISFNLVVSLFQYKDDKQGIIWVGTWGGGLNKFDTKTGVFEAFQNKQGNPDSLSNDNVWVIRRDSEDSNILWLGTENGINRFSIDTGTFKRYLHNNLDAKLNNTINDIYIVKQTSSILAATKKGLFKYDKDSDRFMECKFDFEDAQRKKVKAICQCPGGLFWIGTEGGLFLYNSINGNVYEISHHKFNEPELSKVSINTIKHFNETQIWVGTLDKGVFVIDIKSKDIRHFHHDTNQSSSLSYNDVRSIFRDRTGLIWLGTYGGGLNKFDANKTKFELYRNIPNNKNSMSDNDVTSIVESRFHEGKVWVATRGGGLDLFNPETKTFENFGAPQVETINKKYPPIRAIWEDDHHDTLWVGTERYGMFKLDLNKQAKGTEDMFSRPGYLDISDEEYILCIKETKKGMLWIGTMGGGLIWVDKARLKSDRYGDGKRGLKNKKIFSIFEDKQGTLWIGTGGGLYKMENGKFSGFSANIDNSKSISNYLILSFHEDKKGNLWIGTNGGGLNRIDKKNTFKAYTYRDGLPDDTIYDILEDESGYLWLSTNRGLCRFNPGDGSVRIFTLRDGLQSYEFNRWAALKTGDGVMYLGGLKGLNRFKPKSIEDLSPEPVVVITSIKKLDKELKLSMNTKQPTLNLKYYDSYISFEFAVLDFTDPASNRYAYRLREGDKWIQLGTSNVITFPEFEPGEYSLDIKGCNNENKWKELKTPIRIVVPPPIWKNPFFIILAVLIILGATFWLVRTRIKIIERRKNVLQQEVEERKEAQEKLKESEERYRTLVETSPEAITMCTPGGKIIMTNKQSAHLLGYEDVDDLQKGGKSLFRLISKKDLPRMREVFRKGKTEILEFELCAKDKTLVAVESSISLMKDRGGKPKYVLAITRDIRERKEAEKREKTLTQIDKMVSLGTLLSGIAHELNNPAGFIMMNSENFSRVWEEVEIVLDRYHKENPNFQIVGMPYEGARDQIKELLKGLLDGSHRIKNIIKELKEYSRPEDVVKKAVDVNKILNSSLQLTSGAIRKCTNIFDANLEENLPILWGSPQRLEQVFINLIQNACHALNSREKKLEIVSRFDKENNHIVVQVIDEGVGIDQKFMKQILDPFFTTKRTTGGTGLGLTISQRIVKEHGGEINFESIPGKGTTVTVILPAASFTLKENGETNIN